VAQGVGPEFNTSVLLAGVGCGVVLRFTFIKTQKDFLPDWIRNVRERGNPKFFGMK
jgi:hypothetical protein